jgi:Arc/MetJ-type ribon-helix-helix transcriptional regulator
MVSTFSLPRLMEEEVSALVRSGHYSSKSDVIKDAMRLLFKSKTNLRHAAAIELMKEGKISLGKAAEIAEMSVQELQQMMEHHKVFKEIKTEKSDLERISETR